MNATEHKVRNSDRASSSARIALPADTSATDDGWPVTVLEVTRTAVRTRKKPALSPIESAVFGHIRAMRALGHTTANTARIATALGLPLDAVERATLSLRSGGVKRRR